MPSSLTPFAFEEALVRVQHDAEGNPLFVAKDIALALGYVWKGFDNVRHIPEEWRVVQSVWTSFGEKDMHLLTEQGVYFFLGRSDKPKALPFQKWLAGEVLPSLRRTGVFAMPGTQSTENSHNGPQPLPLPPQAQLEGMPKYARQQCMECLRSIAVAHKEHAPTMAATVLALAATAPPEPEPQPHPEPAELQRFWQVWEAMEAKGLPVNHTATPGLVALHLPTVLQLAAQHAPSVPPGTPVNPLPLRRQFGQGQRYPLLARNKGVNSHLQAKLVKCWIFRHRRVGFTPVAQ